MSPVSACNKNIPSLCTILYLIRNPEKLAKHDFLIKHENHLKSRISGFRFSPEWFSYSHCGFRCKSAIDGKHGNLFKTKSCHHELAEGKRRIPSHRQGDFSVASLSQQLYVKTLDVKACTDYNYMQAGMAELADAADLKSATVRCVGSSPSPGTSEIKTSKFKKKS